jgi:hypothetical protein
MLMAEGIQRNAAHKMACCIQKAGIPYNDAFLSRHKFSVSFLMYTEEWKKAVLSTIKALNDLSEKIKKLGKSYE